MTLLIWAALIFAAAALAAAGLSAWGERRWARTVQALLGDLEAGRTDSRRGAEAAPLRYDTRELQGLPAPVQRFFRAALKPGQPIINAATISMAGTFNMSANGQQWKPFTARQRVATRRPGFVWDAEIALLPGVTVRVVDSFVRGQGLLRAAAQGLLTVASQRGGGDIARGEFMRWFAEAAWYPTALLPSQGVRWQAVDEHSANATVVDGPLALTLLFRFNKAGLIDSFRAESRGSTVGGKLVLAPWEGAWSDYRTHKGMQLPFTGEVAWMRPDGRKPYFVGTVSALAYEFAC